MMLFAKGSAICNFIYRADNTAIEVAGVAWLFAGGVDIFESAGLNGERNVQWLADRFLGANEGTRGKVLIGEELGVSQATVSRTECAEVDSIVANANE